MTRRLASKSRYLPLDELLELPRVRVLRALRRFDEVSVPDLNEALGAGTRAAKDAAWRALTDLLARALVAERNDRGVRMLRITDAGRDELAAILAKGEINESRAYPRRKDSAA